MKLENLLEKEDKRKIQLVQMLEEAPNLESIHIRLQERLDISTFVYKKTVEELKQELQEFQLSDFIDLEETEMTLMLKESEQVTSEVLLREYVKDSITYQLLKTILKGELTNLQDFALDNYIGYKTAYNRTKTLKEFLQDHQVDLDRRSNYAGDQQTIRMLLTAVFVSIEQGDDSLVPSTWRDQIHDFIDRIGDRPDLTFTQQQKITLMHYLTVVYYRSQVEEAENPWSEADFRQLQQVMADYLDLKESIARFLQIFLKDHYQEAYLYEVMLYLMGTQTLNLSNVRLAESDFLGLKDISFSFVEEVQDSITLSQNSRERLLIGVATLHYVLKHFPLQSYLIRDKADLQFFHKNYPEFFRITQTFILKHKQENSVPIWQHKVYLFYAYFFVLLDSVPLSDFIGSLTVCVDFSLGSAYNRYLSESMRFFTGLNLNIVGQMQPEVDLLLTDVPLLTKEPVEKVVWLSPPRPVDWENLAKKLIDIRDAKGKQHQRGRR